MQFFFFVINSIVRMKSFLQLLMVVVLLLLLTTDYVRSECNVSPQSLTMRIGNDVFLDCECTESVNNLNWCLEPECTATLSTGSDYDIVTTASKSTLTVINAQVDDTRTYYCSNGTGTGSVLDQGDITIVDVPIAELSANPSTIVYGEDVTLTCNLRDGNDVVVTEPVVWKKNGINITENLDLDGNDVNDIELDGQGLILKDTNSTDGGVYSCGLYDRELQVESSVTLETEVQVSHKINSKNGQLSISCFAKGYPIPKVTYEGVYADKDMSKETHLLSSMSSVEYFYDLDTCMESATHKCLAKDSTGSFTETEFSSGMECSGCSCFRPTTWIYAIVFIITYFYSQ